MLVNSDRHILVGRNELLHTPNSLLLYPTLFRCSARLSTSQAIRSVYSETYHEMLCALLVNS